MVHRNCCCCKRSEVVASQLRGRRSSSELRHQSDHSSHPPAEEQCCSSGFGCTVEELIVADCTADCIVDHWHPDHQRLGACRSSQYRSMA